MSRAFVKETDAAVDALPDRPISPHRNLVTETGLARIDDEITALRARLTEATERGEAQAVAAVSRDLRYWTARRASAELVEAAVGEGVRFGSRVTIRREDGREQTYHIVGEDEADPQAGTLSYVAPLARALIGKEEGDEIGFMGDAIEIVGVA